MDYDAAECLARSLASVTAQGGQVVATVVVENGTNRVVEEATEGSVEPERAPAGTPAPIPADGAEPAGGTPRAGGRVGGTLSGVVVSGRNLGYGAGANRGIAALADRGDVAYLLIMNSDVDLHRGVVGQLAAALDADPSLAIVGPTILTPAGEVYPSARRFPSLVDAAGHALLGLLQPDNRFSRRYRDGTEPESSGQSCRSVDWISGACLMARFSALEELGGFDERFFMFAEDVDLCWRAHRGGWGVAVVPSSAVTHIQGVSTRKQPYRMLAEHHRSAWRFACRSATGWRVLALPAIAVGLAVRFLADLVGRLVRAGG